jgi:hypothetical protein
MKTTKGICDLCKRETEVTKLQIEDEQHAFCESCFVKSAFISFKSVDTLDKMSKDESLTEETRKQAKMQEETINRIYEIQEFNYKDISEN